MIAKITQALADKTPLLPSGNAPYSDSDLRGFMFIVGQTAKRYYVQTVVQGRQVRVKVGDHPMLSAKEAREQARQTLAAMKGETNPTSRRGRPSAAAPRCERRSTFISAPRRDRRRR